MAMLEGAFADALSKLPSSTDQSTLRFEQHATLPNLVGLNGYNHFSPPLHLGAEGDVPGPELLRFFNAHTQKA